VLQVEVQETIAKPAPVVYDFVITNYVQNHPKWDPKTVRTELTGGGPIAAGAKGIEVRRDRGTKEATYDWVVTELTADHLTFDARQRDGKATFGGVWKVTPAGEGTSTLSITFRLGLGGFARLFEPLAKGAVRKDMQASAGRIKSLVEAQG
jgi:hypothetical protein